MRAQFRLQRSNGTFVEPGEMIRTWVGPRQFISVSASHVCVSDCSLGYTNTYCTSIDGFPDYRAVKIET